MELIDKKPLIRHLVDWQMEQFAEVGHEREFNLLDLIIKGIENEPTVEAKEVVNAKWEECAWVEFDGIHCGIYTYPNGGLACSNCHHAFKKELLCPDNFCPNCGADMRTSAE